MYFNMYNPMYPTQPHPPAPLHPIHPDPKPAGQARRRAPEVDLEWPVPDPKPDRSLDLLIWSILALSLASAIALRDPVLLLLASVLVLGLLGLYLLSALQGREAGRADHALYRAIRAVRDREHPRRVLDGLSGLELHGRPGLRLGVARRCLDEARKNHRLEWRLRREAVRWLLATKDELDKDVRA